MAASSRGSGSELSAIANAPKAGALAFAVPFACFDRPADFSCNGYDLLRRLLRLLLMIAKTTSAAIRAPAMAQPTPIPAAAPLERPFEDEDRCALGFEVEDDWLSAVALEEPDMLAEAAEADDSAAEEVLKESVDVL